MKYDVNCFVSNLYRQFISLIIFYFVQDALATEDCGKTVGCLRYPSGCSGTDCAYIATYRYQDDNVTFEMFGKDADWVAIGFSDSNVMV